MTTKAGEASYGRDNYELNENGKTVTTGREREMEREMR